MLMLPGQPRRRIPTLLCIHLRGGAMTFLRKLQIGACGLLCVAFAVGRADAASCPPGSVNRTVTVCAPAPNALTQSPVHVTASTTDTNPVSTVQVYVDNKLVTQVKAASIDTFLNLSVGNHLITVQAWDSAGSFKTSVPVAMQPPCALNPANQTV